MAPHRELFDLARSLGVPVPGDPPSAGLLK
jgi:hypothetical protein